MIKREAFVVCDQCGAKKLITPKSKQKKLPVFDDKPPEEKWTFVPIEGGLYYCPSCVRESLDMLDSLKP